MIATTINYVSGAIAWGPKEVPKSTAIGSLIQEASKAVGQDPSVVTLVLEKDTLDDAKTLEDLMLPSAELVLTMVVREETELEKAQDIFKKVVQKIEGKGYVQEKANLNHILEDYVPTALKRLAQCAGMRELPADVAAWLHIFLTCNKSIFCCESLGHNSTFELNIDGLLWQGVEGCDIWTDNRAMKPGGMLYISMFGDNDDLILHMVDVAGELHRLYRGGPAKGGVWFAMVNDEVWNDSGHLSAQFWKRVKRGNISEDILVGVEPVCIAPSLGHFFEAVAETGEIPSHVLDTTSAATKYVPNIACQWLGPQAVSPPPMDPLIVPAPEGATEMKVTTKKAPGFYANAACSFLTGMPAKQVEGEEIAAKPPVECLRISGLGEATGVAIAAASRAVSQGLGVIVKIQTAYPDMEMQYGCPQIIIDLKKS